MGTFIMITQNSNPDRDVNGSMIQSLDVLDFGMVHLSWYERLQKRYAKPIQSKLKIKKSDTNRIASLNSMAAVTAATEILKSRALLVRQSHIPLQAPELNRTVAVMPFLGSDMGAGHSKLSNRFDAHNDLS